MITADDAMLTLYEQAQGVYQSGPYATTSRQFMPDPWPKTSEFVPDTLLVPPPGSDPGSPDFQSGAMTTSAKEAGLVGDERIELPTNCV